MSKKIMPLLVVLPGGSVQKERKYYKFCNTDDCLETITNGTLNCKCGEDISLWHWQWENDPYATNLKLSNNNRDVLFHPLYSSGTAAVKGPAPFEQNMHHYWEVKILSKCYGTDVMVGIGTSKIDYETFKMSFCSMLGFDSNSYGYSYMGVIQHNKMRRRYGPRFDLGSIVGVHLDLCNGTMEYYLNRKPLGIAFRGLKNKDLYPIVSSTAAKSSSRLTCSVSQKPSLQMMCLKTVMKHPGLHEKYRTITGLTRIYDRDYFWIRPYEREPEMDEQKKLKKLEQDVTLSLGWTRKKKRLFQPPLASNSDNDSAGSSTDEDMAPCKRIFYSAHRKIWSCNDPGVSISDSESQEENSSESVDAKDDL